MSVGGHIDDRVQTSLNRVAMDHQPIIMDTWDINPKLDTSLSSGPEGNLYQVCRLCR